MDFKKARSTVFHRNFLMRLSGHKVICAGTAEQELWALKAESSLPWEPCRGGFIVEWKPIQTVVSLGYTSSWNTLYFSSPMLGKIGDIRQIKKVTKQMKLLVHERGLQGT